MLVLILFRYTLWQYAETVSVRRGKPALLRIAVVVVLPTVRLIKDPARWV